MEFKELIRTRYLCKAYDSGRQLSPETLSEILEAGRMAPTAKNLQEQHIYVCQSPEALANVALPFRIQRTMKERTRKQWCWDKATQRTIMVENGTWKY